MLTRDGCLCVRRRRRRTRHKRCDTHCLQGRDAVQVGIIYYRGETSRAHQGPASVVDLGGTRHGSDVVTGRRHVRVQESGVGGVAFVALPSTLFGSLFLATRAWEAHPTDCTWTTTITSTRALLCSRPPVCADQTRGRVSKCKLLDQMFQVLSNLNQKSCLDLAPKRSARELGVSARSWSPSCRVRPVPACLALSIYRLSHIQPSPLPLHALLHPPRSCHCPVLFSCGI